LSDDKAFALFALGLLILAALGYYIDTRPTGTAAVYVENKTWSVTVEHTQRYRSCRWDFDTNKQKCTTKTRVLNQRTSSGKWNDPIAFPPLFTNLGDREDNRIREHYEIHYRSDNDLYSQKVGRGEYEQYEVENVCQVVLNWRHAVLSDTCLN